MDVQQQEMIMLVDDEQRIADDHRNDLERPEPVSSRLLEALSSLFTTILPLADLTHPQMNLST